MTTINSSLQALLDQFALTNPSTGTNPSASQTFIDAFNASPSLTAQFNALASGGYLLGFSGLPSETGAGGQFNPSTQFFSIPLNADGSVDMSNMNMGSLIHVMGHESIMKAS